MMKHNQRSLLEGKQDRRMDPGLPEAELKSQLESQLGPAGIAASQGLVHRYNELWLTDWITANGIWTPSARKFLTGFFNELPCLQALPANQHQNRGGAGYQWCSLCKNAKGKKEQGRSEPATKQSEERLLQRQARHT